MLDRGDSVRGGRSLGTPNKRTCMYGFHSSSSYRRNNHHHLHHPYRRNEYLPEDFKKLKQVIYDGEMK